MTANGELKALWGMSCMVATYAIYMTCSPDPADGLVLSSIVVPITAIVTNQVIKHRKVKVG